MSKKYFWVLVYIFITWVTYGQSSLLPAFDRSTLDAPVPNYRKSFIESANLSMDPTGFKIRGMKGWGWTPEQYLAEIPILSKYKMNFLMNCYLSLFTIKPDLDNYATWKNEWWLPLSKEVKNDYEKIFEKCREDGISFCFAVHPQLFSPRPIDIENDKDFEDLWQHFAWAQSKGIRWFSVSLDDVKDVKIDGYEHAVLVNKLIKRLRKKDDKAQMIFCPTYYWGTGESEKQVAYFDALSKNLDKDVYVFWTGKKIVPALITDEDAAKFIKMAGHKVILWDNYPVNDGHLTLHLQPVTGRSRNLYKQIDGYMANPFYTQNEIGRIPLFTMADYAFAPQNYTPSSSIMEAIAHQNTDKNKQLALKEVVKLFATDTMNAKTGFNPVTYNFLRILQGANSKNESLQYIKQVEAVTKKFSDTFPNDYTATKKTLQKVLTELRNQYDKKFATDKTQ
ncbi:MAG: beta-N-acetylglucosaminidase domain-containing protein [Niabella sp.]